MIELQGISDADLPKIKNLLINKSRISRKNLEILEIPAEETQIKIKIYDDFNDLTTQQLNDFYNNHGFAFGFDDLQFIQDYFKSEKKSNLFETELKVLDTYWTTIVVILL